MRYLVLVMVGLICGACSGSNNKFDPNDTAAGATGGGVTGTATSTGSGTTSATSTTTTTSSTTGATTGTTSTSETGFGSWTGITPMNVNTAVLTAAGQSSFTALMFEATLTPTQLCDGNTLSEAAALDPNAVAITFSAIGAFDTGRQYSIGPGQSAQVVELSPSSATSPTFGPFGTTHAAVSGTLTFTSYDQHTLQAQFSGQMAQFPDGGGLVPFTGSIQASACQ